MGVLCQKEWVARGAPVMTTLRLFTLVLLACLLHPGEDGRPRSPDGAPRQVGRSRPSDGRWSARPVGDAPGRSPRRPGKNAVLSQDEDENEEPLKRSTPPSGAAQAAVLPVARPANHARTRNAPPRQGPVPGPLYLTLLTLLL
jgi:hypothetical protein